MHLARQLFHTYTSEPHCRSAPVASGKEQRPPLLFTSSIRAAAWRFVHLFPLPCHEESVFGVRRWQHKALGFVLLFFLLESRQLTWRRITEDFITVFQYLNGSYKEDGGFPFTRSHMEKIRLNGYKLHQERFHQ